MQPNKATSAEPRQSFIASVMNHVSVEAVQLGALALTIIIISIAMQSNYEYFMTPLNIEIMLMGFVTEAIIALGMTIVIISGGIDLSVAAVLPFTAIIAGKLLNANVPVPLAIILALLAAMLIGLINAGMVNRFRVHPFIATLATLLTLRGLNLVITDGSTVSGFPDAFKEIGQGRIGDIPYPLIIFAVLAIIIGFALANHPYFRQAYFIGGNRRSAKMSGINVERYMIFAFMLSAFLAGVGGIVTAAQYGAASNSYGQNMELRVITSVAIGGASLMGGTGSIPGTLLGVLFLAIVYNAFAMTGVSTYWQDVVIGAMLLFAVLLSEYLKRKRLEQ